MSTLRHHNNSCQLLPSKQGLRVANSVLSSAKRVDVNNSCLNFLLLVVLKISVRVTFFIRAHLPTIREFLCSIAMIRKLEQK